MMIPTFLSELVRTIIIMTLSGGLLALLLLLIKPIVRHRLPKSAQYGFWLVVLATFLIPASRIVALPGAIADIAPIHNVVEQNIISTAEARDRLPAWDMPISAATPNFADIPSLPDAAAPTTALEETPGFVTRAVTVFMVIYPFIFALVLLYNLIGYANFVKKLRRNYIRPHSFELDMLGALTNGKRTPKLIVSDYAATPMLIGIFKPMIVLPNREYTDEQIQVILLHELTHMRRFDVGIKWLSLLACAVHWFNPVVWIAKREIDRICELSCDEAVIRNMDKYGKQHYGETLISVASNKKIPLPVLSTTMCEEKRALKERLTAIMKSKKHTKLAILVSSIILLAVVFVACTAGAGGGNRNNADVSDLPSSVHQAAVELLGEMPTIFTGVPWAETAWDLDAERSISTGRYELYFNQQLIITEEVPDFYASFVEGVGHRFLDRQGDIIHEAPWMYSHDNYGWWSYFYAEHFMIIDVDNDGIPEILVRYMPIFDQTFSAFYRIFRYVDGAYRALELRAFENGAESPNPWIGSAHILFRDNAGRFITFINRYIFLGLARYEHLVLTDEYAELHLITAANDENWDAWDAHHWEEWNETSRGLVMTDGWHLNNPVIFGMDIPLTPVEPLHEIQATITASVMQRLGIVIQQETENINTDEIYSPTPSAFNPGEPVQRIDIANRVNIMDLIGVNFDEVSHLLGNLIYVETDVPWEPLHSFDTGVDIAFHMSEENGVIITIIIDYREDDSASFHYNGIDGTSTREDVRTRLGTPHDVWDIIGNQFDADGGLSYHYGIIISHEGHELHHFSFSTITFIFDSDNRLIMTQLRLSSGYQLPSEDRGLFLP